MSGIVPAEREADAQLIRFCAPVSLVALATGVTGYVTTRGTGSFDGQASG